MRIQVERNGAVAETGQPPCVHLTVLGPMSALVAGRTVHLGGRQPRMILAQLIGSRGHVVSDDALIDAVWGANPPRSARQAVHTYIRHLRRALEPDRAPRGTPQVLVRHAGGYCLDLPRPDIDAELFVDLAAAGATALGDGLPRQAVTQLDAALDLWRGPAYADLGSSPAVQGAVRQLELARVAARENLVAAHLDLGDHHRVLGAAQALTDDHPLHERAWELRVLALYRCGRQAEALAGLRAARAGLRKELDVEPGPGLRALDRAVRQRDAALDWQPPVRRPRLPRMPPPHRWDDWHGCFWRRPAPAARLAS